MLTQRQVVFGGTTVVTVALNLYFPAFLLDDLCSLCESLLRIRTQVSLVIVEVNVLDHLSKELFVGDSRCGRRCGRWSRFCCHLNLRSGFLRSGCALRGQMIRGGLRRRDGLRSAGINLVAIQSNVSCVFRAPGQRGRLASLNGSRVGGKCGAYCFRRRWRWWRSLFLLTAACHHQESEHPQDDDPIALALIHLMSSKKSNAIYYKAYLKLQLGWLLRPWRVNCCKCVPSARTLQICSLPVRLDWNTMCRPSGDHDGKSFRPPSCVNCMICREAISIR